jgi:hypothetical protein
MPHKVVATNTRLLHFAYLIPDARHDYINTINTFLCNYNNAKCRLPSPTTCVPSVVMGQVTIMSSTSLPQTSHCSSDRHGNQSPIQHFLTLCQFTIIVALLFVNCPWFVPLPCWLYCLPLCSTHTPSQVPLLPLLLLFNQISGWDIASVQFPDDDRRQRAGFTHKYYLG